MCIWNSLGILVKYHEIPAVKKLRYRSAFHPQRMAESSKMIDHPVLWPGGQRASFYKLANALWKATKVCVPHVRSLKVFIPLGIFPEGHENPQGAATTILTKRCRVWVGPQGLWQDTRPPPPKWTRGWKLKTVSKKASQLSAIWKNPTVLPGRRFR